MDKYITKYLNSEEKDLDEAINLIDENKLKKPTSKEQKQFKDAANNFIKKQVTMNIKMTPLS